MNVKVRTNCLSKDKSCQMVEIEFSSKPDSDVIKTLKENRWWWMPKKGCWSHYYSEENVDFAFSIANRYKSKKVKYYRCEYPSFYKDDDPFAYLRKKTPMSKKHDYGEVKKGANMTSVYDCKSRLVSRVS